MNHILILSNHNCSLVLRGPEAVYNNHWGVSGVAADGPESFKCRCIQEPINCQPDDGYDVSR